MPNEYGKILLQQIEQQRRQRLKQRAEERGLPIPPDEQIRLSPSSTAVHAAGWTAEASASSRSAGDPPPEAEVKPQEGHCADASTEVKNSNLQRRATQESGDVASVLQSLAALAPLIARHPPYFAPHSESISTASIPSVVPAPLIHQQPLLLQPTALVHPPLYPLAPQQLPYITQQQAQDQNLTLPMRNNDESISRDPPAFNAAPTKECSNSEETLNQATRSSGGALLNFGETDPGQQRLKDAKKRYQADLLRQMRERAEEREAEKSRRKREDEEERIRLNREIEQERLAKEEEDALQLARSKQLAEANVAAAGQPKLRQPHQAPAASLDFDVGVQHGLAGSNRFMHDQEYVEKPQRENANGVPPEMKFQRDSANEPRGHEVPCDKLVQQMSATAVEADRSLLLGLEALQAEVRMQTEEMRHLKDQQRHVLQHIHQGTVCCERQCCSTEARDFCAWHPTAHARNTPMNTKIASEQHALQAQYAVATTVLRNAGISDPEDVMRRLAQSGAISMGCDPPCHGVVPVDRVPCQYASATPDRPGQLLEGPSTCETLRCGAPHCSSTKQSLSRGLSNSSCCSLHEGTAEVPTQHGKRECTSNKKDGTYVEDPEDRPLPTLLKRQQQPLHTQRQPGSQLPENVVQHRREQLQQQPMKTANRPEASAEKESDTVVENGVKGKWEGAADERPCRAVGRAKVSNSTNMPADRRWRFNELWACLSHGFPPPPALGPIIRVSDKDRDDPLSVTSSWCTSECESELPCQTILLPHASNCTTPPVGKRVQQCIARQIETFSKDGWLPTSQMETLEESTGQTCMPDEHDQLSRKEQDLYKAFAPRMENGGAYEGISVANERATLMTRRIPETSRFDAFDARRERVPETPPADVDFNRGKSVLREDRLFLTNDQQICRALSVGAAPLKLQQLRQWDSHIRQKYNADVSLRERYLHQLNAVAGHRQAPGRSFQNASLPRAHEIFKSRLSWEADTAFPMDEGSPAQPHLKNAELKPPAHRPLAPELQAKSSPTTGEASIPSAQGKAEAFSPRPAKPPNKHALPVQKSARSSSVSVINKKSRFTRAFLGAMLPRSSSRTRQ